MNTRRIGKITLVFPSEEQATADLIGETCDRAVSLVQERWGLESPARCSIYVMTSWLGFVFQSAPWAWRAMLGATIPLWCFRVRRTWLYSAAWTQRYGRRIAIGVKPPRLLEKSDRSIGVRLFVEENDMRMKMQHVACHELVHAYSADLMLPMWLNEGIAMEMVDRFVGRPTIRNDTLQYMKGYLPKAAPPTYRHLSQMDSEAIAYHAVRGYWLVRYLEEQYPGLLKDMFSARHDSKFIEGRIIAATSLNPETFWTEIDDRLVDHFETKRGT